MKKWIFLAGTIVGGLYVIKKVTRKMERGILVWNPKKEEPKVETEEEA